MPVLTLLCSAIVLAESSSMGGRHSGSGRRPLFSSSSLGCGPELLGRKIGNFRRVFAWFCLASIPLMFVTGLFFVGWPFNPERMAAFPDLLVVLGAFLTLVALDRRPAGLPEIRPLR